MLTAAPYDQQRLATVSIAVVFLVESGLCLLLTPPTCQNLSVL
jgi:hypothetical protein